MALSVNPGVGKGGGGGGVSGSGGGEGYIRGKRMPHSPIIDFAPLRFPDGVMFRVFRRLRLHCTRMVSAVGQICSLRFCFGMPNGHG